MHRYGKKKGKNDGRNKDGFLPARDEEPQLAIEMK